MKSSITLFMFAAVLSQAYSAPQFITFQDGKLGVNFLGYHAGVGIGGSLANGTLGGLYAEAGTPTGQLASAGLGGVVDKNGHASGGLYAGATAGNNIQAAAGLGGGVNNENSAGAGYASAQSGNRIVSSGLVGEAGVEGSSGFTYSGTKQVSLIPSQHKVETEFNVDSNVNEVEPLSKSQVEIQKTIIKEHAPPPVIVKEVLVEQQPQIVEKHIIHTHLKHGHPHLHKTTYVSGFVGGEANSAPAETVYQNGPAVERRVDVGVESGTGGGVEGNLNGGAGFNQVYRKNVSIQRNPSFFRDIFDIPISTLKAVGNFLGNTASKTNISVQKSASVETGSDSQLNNNPSSSSSSHISVETQPGSSFIDDIFSIPINTLGAVNRFLENNVARKNVQVVQEVQSTPTRVRRVPHARRRANKIFEARANISSQ